MGGIVLHQGKIAEMKTGEGKTLAATLPLYLNALPGKGVHLVTVNDYLAHRDSEWMKPVYESLGLTVGYLKSQMPDAERKKQYQVDILYATNNELGFDYLRDNMKFRLQDYAQRDLNYAIVDEVDSILIDEARTPLIISGSTAEAAHHYQSADKAVRQLKKEIDYELDEKERSALLTDAGNDKIEEFFRIDNLYAIENINILHQVKQALKAHTTFRKDVDYVVQGGQVLIVDEFTGRILSGRRYSDGLHQALEAKEGVTIEEETHTLASITLQNYFRLYKKLAGMTGTALTESEEFYKIYKLHVVAVPTNREMIRDDKPDLIFLTKNAKYALIAEDVKERYEKKQPVLIGTVAIETSELLSAVLKKAGVPHEILNAKQHQREAEIIEHAGEPGHITIATNMAGRGTDIKLTPESVEAGGLYILGTERHESRRIDNQLRGRSGRQGDQGESRFYISLEDDLVRRFAGDQLRSRMEYLGMQEDETIESKVVSRSIERAQEKVEKHNFEIRKHLIEYDDVLNQQRAVIYGIRHEILTGNDQIYALMRDWISNTVQDYVAFHCPDRAVNAEQVAALFRDMSAMIGIPIDRFESVGIGTKQVEMLTRDLINFLLEQYALRRNQYGKKDEENDDPVRADKIRSMLHEAEKWLLLETVDQAWKQHMINLDHLKEGINLRSWGQKNPLIEYKREAFAMFEDMMRSMRRDVVHQIFHLEHKHLDTHLLEERRQREMKEMNLLSGGEDSSGAEGTAAAHRAEPKVGRNDPCPCGSDKKYKKCCDK